jgi:lambda repressor-like predicted transcriptional regulator
MYRSDAVEELAYFRKRIGALCEVKGWNCEELCRRAGLPATTIADYWWRRGPSIDEVAAFAKTLGVTPHEIWYDEPIVAKDNKQPRPTVKPAVVIEPASGAESFSSKPRRRAPSKAHVLSTADVCCVLNDMRPRALGYLRRKGKIEFLPDHNGEVGFRRRHVKEFLCREWKTPYNAAALAKHSITTEHIERYREEQRMAAARARGLQIADKLALKRRLQAEQPAKTGLHAPMRLIAHGAKSREARAVLNRLMHWCRAAATAAMTADTKRAGQCDLIISEYHTLIECMLPATPSKSKLGRGT